MTPEAQIVPQRTHICVGPLPSIMAILNMVWTINMILCNMLKTALFHQAGTIVPELSGNMPGTLSSIPALQLGRGTHVPLAVAMRLEPPPGCSRQAAARGTAVGTALTPAMYTLKEEGMLPGACSSMTPVLWSANSSFTPCRAAHELQPCCVHAWSIRSCATCTHGVVPFSGQHVSGAKQ